MQQGVQFQLSVGLVADQRDGEGPGLDFLIALQKTDMDSSFMFTPVDAEPDIDGFQRGVLETDELLLQQLARFVAV